MPIKKTSGKPTIGDTGDAGSFELSLQELKKIVSDLESGELDLTGSLERYENGIRRLKECHEFLTLAEQKVSQLVGFDAEGNPMLETIGSTESEDLTEKQQARQSRRSAKVGTAGDSSGTQQRSAKSRSQESVDEFPELF